MKNMKKSMFITTILMVVLLVVAISTATLAWFSSNNTVTAEQATMTAATSSDASIGIGWTVDAAKASDAISISFDDVTDLYPSMPTKQPLAESTDLLQYNIAASALYEGANFSSRNFVAQAFEFNSTKYDYLKVIGLTQDNLDNDTITKTAATEAPYSLSNPASYAKLYMAKAAVTAGFKSYKTNFPASADEYELIEGNPFVTIVGTGITAGPNEVCIDDIDTEYPDLVAADGAIEAGARIYDIKAVPAKYATVPYNANLPTNNYVDNGLADGSTFRYIVNTVGELDADNHILLADIGTYIVGTAKANDYIYCIRAAASDVAVTKLGDFAFNGSTIDGSARFMQDGLSSGYGGQRLNEKGASTTSSFFISNNATVAGQSVELTIKASIADNSKNSDYLRIAVFTKEFGAADTVYRGTLGNTATTVYGSVVQQAYANNAQTYDATVAGTGFTIGEITSGETLEVIVWVWYDGKGLTAEGGGYGTDFTLDFIAL